MTYGMVLAISHPVEHYPAVIVERTEYSENTGKPDFTLTVVLDDGDTIKLDVSERLYNMEKMGAKLQVCQKDNFLGIRIVRIHISEDTDLEALLTSDDQKLKENSSQ